MSGIVGILNRNGSAVDPEAFERMTSAVTPGRHEIRIEGHVALGKAQLCAGAEAALERGPTSTSGEVWVTADARIDGRAELVTALRASGRPAELTATDESLILESYLAWGEKCVEHLIGDFAFAIWDSPRRRLFCARDQFGVTPFYYAVAGNTLLFSNSICCLRAHPSVADELNERSIGDFLLFGQKLETSATSFAAIQSLPPAHTLTWADDVIDVRRYWDLPEGPDYIRFTRPHEYVEQFTALFELAVHDRLRTRAVGTHLSGGLDSTGIAVMARELLAAEPQPFDLRGYTLVFDRLFDEEERHYGDRVAQRIDIPVEHVVVDEYIGRAPDDDPAWRFPEPRTIPEQSADREIARRVSTFSEILLAGFGGDPLLNARPVIAPSGRPRHWREIARSAFLDLAVDGRVPRIGLRSAIRSRRRGGQRAAPPLPAWIDPAFAERTDLATRSAAALDLARSSTPRSLLLWPGWVDIFASGHPATHGLRVKTVFPFFDVRLVEYVLRVPPLPWRRDKRLLRDAMRGRLPEEVRRRPKTPLYVPDGRAVENHPLSRLGRQPEVRRWRRELILASPLSPFVDAEQALAAIEALPSRPADLVALEHLFPLAHWLSHRRHPM